MKPKESSPSATPVADSSLRSPDAQLEPVAEESLTEEQAFYAAQEIAFADLSAYHARRTRINPPAPDRPGGGAGSATAPA